MADEVNKTEGKTSLVNEGLGSTVQDGWTNVNTRSVRSNAACTIQTMVRGWRYRKRVREREALQARWKGKDKRAHGILKTILEPREHQSEMETSHPGTDDVGTLRRLLGTAVKRLDAAKRMNMMLQDRLGDPGNRSAKGDANKENHGARDESNPSSKSSIIGRLWSSARRLMSTNRAQEDKYRELALTENDVPTWGNGEDGTSEIDEEELVSDASVDGEERVKPMRRFDECGYERTKTTASPLTMGLETLNQKLEYARERVGSKKQTVRGEAALPFSRRDIGLFRPAVQAGDARFSRRRLLEAKGFTTDEHMQMTAAIGRALRQSEVAWPELPASKIHDQEYLTRWCEMWDDAARQAEEERHRGINSPKKTASMCLKAELRTKVLRTFFYGTLNFDPEDRFDIGHAAHHFHKYVMGIGPYVVLQKRRKEILPAGTLQRALMNLKCAVAARGKLEATIRRYFDKVTATVLRYKTFRCDKMIIRVLLNEKLKLRERKEDTAIANVQYGIRPVKFRIRVAELLTRSAESRILRSDFREFKIAVLALAYQVDETERLVGEIDWASEARGKAQGDIKTKKRNRSRTLLRHSHRRAEFLRGRGDVDELVEDTEMGDSSSEEMDDNEGSSADELNNSPVEVQYRQVQRSQDGNKGELKCFNCGLPGHLSTACTLPKRCHRCHEFGHTRDDCPRPRLPKGKRYCMKCGELHLVVNCPIASEEEKARSFGAWISHKAKKFIAQKKKGVSTTHRALRVSDCHSPEQQLSSESSEEEDEGGRQYETISYRRVVQEVNATKDTDLVSLKRIEAGLADDIAFVGDVRLAVMFFLDDGCNPRNAVAKRLAERILKAASIVGEPAAVEIKKVRPFKIRLAAEGDGEKIIGSECLVIKKLAIERRDEGFVTLEMVEFDILPGDGQELLIGRETATKGLHAVSLHDQVCPDLERIRQRVLDREIPWKKAARSSRACSRFAAYIKEMRGFNALTLQDCESDDEFGFEKDDVLKLGNPKADEKGETLPHLSRGITIENSSERPQDTELGMESTTGVYGHVYREVVLEDYIRSGPVDPRQREDGTVSLSREAFGANSTVQYISTPMAGDLYNIVTERALNTIKPSGYTVENVAASTRLTPLVAEMLGRKSEQVESNKWVVFKETFFHDHRYRDFRPRNVRCLVVEADAAVVIVGNETHREMEEQEYSPDFKVTSEIAEARKKDRGEVTKQLQQVLKDAEQAGASKEFISAARKILQDNIGLFATTFGLHPPSKAPKMQIQLVEGAPDHWSDGHRNYSIDARDAMKEVIDRLKKAGVVTESDSRFMGSVVMVKKPGGGWRFCADLRQLNKWLKRRHYEMPMVIHMLQRLGKTRCLCKLDILRGFWNIEVEESTRKYFGVMTPFGGIEFCVLPMGCADSAQHFQAFMHKILDDLIDKKVLVLIDDVLLLGEGDSNEEAEQDLLRTLEVVLARLKNAGMKAAPKKLELYNTRMVFGGFDVVVGETEKHIPDGAHQIGKAGYAIERRRVQAIVDLPQPETLSDLGDLTHVANWCRQFIPSYALLSKPLTDFAKQVWSKREKEVAEKRRSKNNKKKLRRNKAAAARLKLRDYGWNEGHVKAFEDLRRAMVRSIRLTVYRKDQALLLFGDASEEAYSYMWGQCPWEDIELPVDNMRVSVLTANSGCFKGAEMRWSMTDKEAFWVVQAYRTFPHIAQLSKVHIMNDHDNLKYILSPNPGVGKVVTNRRQRWCEVIRMSDYEIRHTPGKLNTVADIISRFGSRAYADHEFVRGMISAPAAMQATEDEVGGATNPTGKNEGPIQLEGQRRMQSTRRYLALNVEQVDGAETGPVRVRSTPRFSSKDVNIARQKFRPLTFPIEPPTRRDLERCVNSPAVKRAALDYDLTVGKDGTETAGLWVNASGQVYVPDDHRLRERILAAAHQGSEMHRGRKATREKVSKVFWWPELEEDVNEICDTCVCCLLNAEGQKVPRATASTMLPKRPNQVVSIDYMSMVESELVKGGKASGKGYILVLKDCFSQLVELVPVNSANAENAANALVAWVSRIGPPTWLVSDHGSHFVNKVVKRTTAGLGMHHHITPVYNPQSNGSVERANREILKAMRRLKVERKLVKEDWELMLPAVQFGLNATGIASLGGRSPIEVHTGNTVKSAMDLILLWGAEDVGVRTGSIVEYVAQAREAMTAMHQQVFETKRARAERAVWLREKQRGTRRSGKLGKLVTRQEDGLQSRWFCAGDFILLAERKLDEFGTNKLRCKWRGPYMITKMVSDHRMLVRRFAVTGLIGPTLEATSRRIKLFAEAGYDMPAEVLEAGGYGEETFELARCSNWRPSEWIGDAQYDVYCEYVGYLPQDGSWQPLIDVVKTGRDRVIEMFTSSYQGRPITKEFQDRVQELVPEWMCVGKKKQKSKKHLGKKKRKRKKRLGKKKRRRVDSVESTDKWIEWVKVPKVGDKVRVCWPFEGQRLWDATVVAKVPLRNNWMLEFETDDGPQRYGFNLGSMRHDELLRKEFSWKYTK